MKLEGARVWLTGASSGIGQALIDPLVAAGARVAITARRADRLAQLARSRPDAVLPVAADVTDRSAVQNAARQIEQAWNGIDLAIFDAGGNEPMSALTLEAGPFVRVMTLNYFSVIYGIEAVLPGMLTRGDGRLAAVASLAGYRGVPGTAPYGASKAALIHALESLRFDLESRGIGVTIINPGFVRTPLTASNRFTMPFLMDVEDAAAVVVRGLQRDRKEIHFPAPFSWTLKLLRIVPYPVYERVMRRIAPRRNEN